MLGAAILALALGGVVVGVNPSWTVMLVPGFWLVPGVLIAAGRPASPLGWLLLAVAAGFAGVLFSTQWLEAGHQSGAAWAAWAADRALAMLMPCMLAVLLLLPDGRLPSPRWRPVAAAVIAVQALGISVWALAEGPAAGPETGLAVDPSLRNPVGVLPAAWGEALVGWDMWALQYPMLLAVPAIGVRLFGNRAADQRERLVSVLAAVVAFVVLVVVGRWFLPPAAEDVLDVAGTALLAASLTAAVLRRRLREVELVVGTAFVYTVLTSLIAGAYVGAVAVTTRLDLPDAGAGVATAVVAVALLPMRRVLQRLLERAMYGDARDPQRAVDRLSDQVGDATGFDDVLDGLVRATATSLRAAYVEARLNGGRAVVGAPRAGPVITVPLSAGDDRPGSLTVGFGPGRRSGRRERQVAAVLAEHGGRALHAMRLAESLSASRHLLVTAREEERSKLRRELHDELGPTLAGLVMQLGTVRDLVGADPATAAQRLARLEDAARSALDDVRQLSRNLRPPSLDELGLVGALQAHAETAGVDLVTHDEPVTVSPAVEVAAYRIGAEAILNVARHSGVRAASLTVRTGTDGLEVTIVDHGRGRCDQPVGVGTVTMRERAEELGGRLAVSETPGGGTTVAFRLPLAAAEAAT